MGRPRKIKFPISLETWLRFVLSGKRPEDRIKIFREWRRKCLTAKFKREPTEQEVADEIKLIREHDAANFAFGFADSLKDFVPEFHKQNRIKRAQTAAAKRWSK